MRLMMHILYRICHLAIYSFLFIAAWLSHIVSEWTDHLKLKALRMIHPSDQALFTAFQMQQALKQAGK